MEKETYNLYDVAKKLYEINPSTKEYNWDELEAFKNWKQKQYHRLHKTTGIPKYAHKNEFGEKSFSKDKFIETLFSLYANSAPYFKKIRLFKQPSLEDIQNITEEYRDFLETHMCDILTPDEIERHLHIFMIRSSLYEEEIFERLRSTFSDYPEIIEEMIHWFSPKPQKENLVRIKKMNKATSAANSYDEVASILDEYSTSHENISTVPFIGLCRDQDRLFVLRKYYKAAMDFHDVYTVQELDLEKPLLKLNEKYRYIIQTFLEIRNTQVDDIIDEEFKNHTSHEYDDSLDDRIQSRIARELMSDEETFHEAIHEYFDRRGRMNIKVNHTKNDIKDLEEVLGINKRTSNK